MLDNKKRAKQLWGDVLLQRHLAALGLLILFLFYNGAAQAILLDPTQKKFLVSEGIEQQVEIQPLTIDEILQSADSRNWTKVKGEINVGYTRTPHWFRLPLTNNTDIAQKRLLELAYPQLDHIEAYLVEKGRLVKQWTTGDTYPHAQRPLEATHFVFPLTVKPLTTLEVYFRIQTEGALMAPITVWQEEAFGAHAVNTIAAQFMFYGMLLVMALYNLFLAVSLRDKAFGYFALNLGVFCFFIASLQGNLFRYVFPNFAELTGPMMLLSQCLSELVLLLFTMEFLSLKTKSPRWYRWLKGQSVVMLLLIISSLLLPYHLVMRASLIMALVILPSCMAVGIFMWRRNQREARFYSLAWVVLLISLFVMLLMWVGALPSSLPAEMFATGGSVLQMLFFSFALADRFNREKTARMKAQQVSYGALQRQYSAESKLLRSYSHDKLTGLPTRALLEEALAGRLAMLNTSKEILLVLLHLSDIKVMNKVLGHENTDLYIQQAAHRIDRYFEQRDDVLAIERTGTSVSKVAHLDGSTFGFFLEANIDAWDATFKTLEEDVAELCRPLDMMHLSLNVTFVAGGSRAGYAYLKDTQTLIRESFIAFDQAKQNINGVAIYSDEMEQYDPEQLSLMAELREAIERDELVLYFQPQINAHNGLVQGVEALLRWQHPQRGLIAPDNFVPLAEKTRLIQPLTDWVIKQALAFGLLLRQEGFRLNLSINISASNLLDNDFSQRLEQILQEITIERSLVTLEVTETVAMANPENALVILHNLRGLGVNLSIDDFGTGYSSLEYVKRLPAQEVKIDNSFVRNMHKNPDDAVIVRTIIAMCRTLGFKVVAEGVENGEIQTLLADMGCDILQGYHIRRPAPADQILRWLNER